MEIDEVSLNVKSWLILQVNNGLVMRGRAYRFRTLSCTFNKVYVTNDQFDVLSRDFEIHCPVSYFCLILFYVDFNLFGVFDGGLRGIFTN